MSNDSGRAPALIAEGAGQGVVGDDAEADLVGHEDHSRRVDLRQRRDQLVDGRRHVAVGAQQIADPQRQAIDEDHIMRLAGRFERGRQCKRLLQRCEALVPLLLVQPHPLPLSYEA